MSGLPTPEQFQIILLQERLSLQEDIRRLAPPEIKGLSGFPEPADLTCGWCQDFARAIHDSVQSIEIVHLNDIGSRWTSIGRPYCHTAVLWQGKWYDAECVAGVDSPTDLLFYKDSSRWNSPRRVAVRNFYAQTLKRKVLKL